MDKNSTNKKEIFLFVLMSIITPIVLGGLVFLFQFSVPYAIIATNWLWENIPHPLYLLIIVALSIVEIILIRLDNLRGDINDIEKYVKKNLPTSPLIDILIVFICALCTFMIGLPLDGDVPTVFMVGVLFVILIHRTFIIFNKKTMIHMGASIGFALAFHNPIAGLAHFFEEYHSRRSIKEVLYFLGEASLAYLSLTLFCFLFGESKSPLTFFYELFNVDLSFGNSFSQVFICSGILLICLCILAFLLNKVIVGFRALFAHKKLFSIIITIVVASLFVFMLRLNEKELALGMGEELYLVRDLASIDLWPLLAIRVLFIVVAFNFYHIGGRTIPSLMLGALIGQIFVAVWNKYLPPIDENLANVLIISSALIYLGVSMKAPLIATSLTFSFGNPLFILPIVVISLLISYFPMKYILPLGLNEEIEKMDHNFERTIKNFSLKRTISKHDFYIL